ncbi:MAG: deoxynucleoside kinase [Bacteroidota bacterium]
MSKKEVRHIAVAGNIGAGKTTLVNKLAQHFGWSPRFEAVEDNPYLEDFYADMAAWAFPLQIFFLNSRFNHVLDIQQEPGPIIQDRTIYEDAYIFAKNLHKSGHLSTRDYETYWGLFNSMSQMIQPPDLLIYLKASIGTLTSQIAKRDRFYERSISIRYLEDLNQHYDEWINNYKEGPLMVINADETDYVKRPEDLGQIIQKIQGELYGLF